MGAYETAVSFLPEGLQRALLRVPITQQRQVQEIRLRKHGLLVLSLPTGAYTVDTTGALSELPCPRSVYCNGYDVEKTFLRLCDYSVHSHSEEIKEGFVTARGGFRAGIAGTAVVEKGAVTAVRDIRSVCLRVASRHDGCAAELLPLFSNRVPSVLIAGEPSSGKTSMLRDLARALSEGVGGIRRRVCVVDERGEIAGAGGLENADVLTAVPKPVGILQAVRTLSPDVIVLDELGTLAEVEAITENLHAGVPAIASAHCRDLAEMQLRPSLQLALRRRVFDKIVFLHGRDVPGSIREIVEVESLEMDRRIGVVSGRGLDRSARGQTTAQAAGNTGNGARLAARF